MTGAYMSIPPAKNALAQYAEKYGDMFSLIQIKSTYEPTFWTTSKIAMVSGAAALLVLTLAGVLFCKKRQEKSKVIQFDGPTFQPLPQSAQ
jgi:hypothetical protein